MVDKALFSSDKTIWETPAKRWHEWNKEFNFDLDAAASVSNTKCRKYFTEEDDALIQNWYDPANGVKTIWINCPYGRNITGKWVKKFYEEAKKGAIIVALLPARTDTKWFHEYIWKKSTEIRFIKGRLKFELDGKVMLDKTGRPQSAPFPSMLVVWRGEEPVNFG